MSSHFIVNIWIGLTVSRHGWLYKGGGGGGVPLNGRGL